MPALRGQYDVFVVHESWLFRETGVIVMVKSHVVWRSSHS